MPHDIEIALLGGLRVLAAGAEVPLPASRKTRALLGFLVATGRPHRRERLCQLFWDLPDDPKAALRWSLSKLRKVVDDPDRLRIVADRERVSFRAEGASVDIAEIEVRLRDAGAVLAVADLEKMARRLEDVFLDGLDGAGDPSFDYWLLNAREDLRLARLGVLQRLCTHPDLPSGAARKWWQLWHAIDPVSAEQHQARSPTPPNQAGSAGDLEDTPRRETGAHGTDRRDPTRRALREQRIGFCEARDGTKIAHATVGSGPPMLKAANWLNHLEFDWASPIWGRSFATIARYRTLVRYDERGSGLSDWDVEDLSFAAFVDDLEAVADDLDLKRFPLLGISQGCAVSIEYAVRHPERVSALILVSGYAAGWRITASPEEKARREAVRQLTEVGWGTDNPAYRHIFSQTFMPDASTEDLAWFDDFQRHTTSPSNAARFQDAFGAIDVRHRLAEVKAPTIVLHAKYDQRIPLEQGRAVAAGIPGARFVPLESRNHILLDREPAWRACAVAVARFMRDAAI